MVLLRRKTRVAWGLWILAYAFSALAAPPLDLTDPNALPDPQVRPKPLSEADIVFVDDPKNPKAASIVVVGVPGRALPSRNGKILGEVKKGDPVQLIRSSKDGRWIAIRHIATGKRYWVPRGVVRSVQPSQPKTDKSGD